MNRGSRQTPDAWHQNSGARQGCRGEKRLSHEELEEREVGGRVRTSRKNEISTDNARGLRTPPAEGGVSLVPPWRSATSRGLSTAAALLRLAALLLIVAGTVLCGYSAAPATAGCRRCPRRAVAFRC